MTTGDEPRTADDIAAEFMREHGHELDQFSDDGDDAGIDYAHATGLVSRGSDCFNDGDMYGFTVLGPGEVNGVAVGQCNDCPHARCVDCERGED